MAFINFSAISEYIADTKNYCDGLDNMYYCHTTIKTSAAEVVYNENTFNDYLKKYFNIDLNDLELFSLSRKCYYHIYNDCIYDYCTNKGNISYSTYNILKKVGEFYGK